MAMVKAMSPSRLNIIIMVLLVVCSLLWMVTHHDRILPFVAEEWGRKDQSSKDGQKDKSMNDVQNEQAVKFEQRIRIFPRIKPNWNGRQRQQIVNAKLRQMGLESVTLHDFPSVYIRDPKIYEEEITPKIPGKRDMKIISCHNCPGWYLTPNGIDDYNRDFKKCPYSECSFDKDGSKQMNATLVMFFYAPRTLSHRPPGQIWAHCTWEPPMRTHHVDYKDYPQWKGAFNWTFGYMQSDDFFNPVNMLAWRDRGKLKTDEEYMRIAKQKTKTAVIWMSHCNAHSGRDEYMKELGKYVDIDIYGKCGPLVCEGWGGCSSMLTTTYKFDLAFENSFCKDYISPRYFRAFIGRNHIVPVVRGGSEYEKFFPPKTFINAKNFTNAKELGMYLKELANDLPRYVRYLKEKDKLVTINIRNDWCEVCERLHTNTKHQTIPDYLEVTHNQNLCWKVNDIF